MDEGKLISLAREFGEKILSQRISNYRVSRMLSVSIEDAKRVRELSHAIAKGEPLQETATTDGVPVEVADGLLFDKDYTYNKETDTYLTFLKGVPKPIVMSGDMHRSLLRAYSNWDGSPATINEAAREFGIPRVWLIKYFRVHGITHDREPFSQEEVMYRPEEDMVEEGLQMLRMSLFKKLEKEKWKTIQSAAKKWHMFETHALQALKNAAADAGARDVPSLNVELSDDRYALVIGLTDFHHGKYAPFEECGEEYNRHLGRRRLLKCVGDVISEALKRGAPDKIYLPIGSDFLHIDTYDGTTTRGTPQDTDGTAHEILETGCHLMEDVVDTLRQVAPVELVLMTGNHDRMMGLSILLYLDARYRNCPDVIVSRDRKPRAYRVFGTNLIGFAHGDGASKTKELAGLMANEASQAWGACKSRTIYTGHLHHERVESDEHFKVVRRQLSSLAGTDRYHKNKGYDSVKALPAFMHSYTAGLVGVIYAYP